MSATPLGSLGESPYLVSGFNFGTWVGGIILDEEKKGVGDGGGGGGGDGEVAGLRIHGGEVR